MWFCHMWQNLLHGVFEDDIRKNLWIGRTDFFNCSRGTQIFHCNKISFNIIEFSGEKKLFEGTGSLKIASNSFSIHLITASKVIHEVCLAIVKHLASKSVPSVSFAVLRSSSVPKLYCFQSSFCNTISLLLLPLFWRNMFKTNLSNIESLFIWVFVWVL